MKVSQESSEENKDSALVFNYKIHQVSVQYTNYNENILSFLINLCAILGGVFTVTKMIDQAVYKTSKVLFKQSINK